MQSR
jgi:hypothetical protein